MIAVVSCSHYPDDERIYHKEIKTLAEKKYNINYFTLSDSDQDLSDNYINHINYSSVKHSVKEYTNLVELEIRKTSAKVIHIHEPELFSLAVNIKKLTGAKIIYDVHEDYVSMIYTFSKWNKYVRYLKSKHWLLKEKFFLKHVDEVIIASSTIVNSDFKIQGFSPVLLENFPLSTFVNNIDISHKIKNSLIYHGNMGPERGITELIESMVHVVKNIPDAKLSLIGGFRTNEYKYEVNRKIDKLGIGKHINLKNHILHQDIWRYLAKHSVGIIPFNENLLTSTNTPTKLFEFMASGCQLVVPSLKPITKYDFKAAKFFKSGDILDLSDMIIKSLENIDQNGIKYNSNKIRSDYNWEKNSYKLIDLYHRILK
ncbi:MAG: hypothetical protein CMG55_03165 [Candidatus Marinimicrobia bacterium]|nr:hypothetical protein [Candidatus Neomarinimicrobiota bacterium]